MMDLQKYYKMIRFPQKVPPRKDDISIEEQQKIQKILDQWPSDASACSIWDKEVRQMLFDKKMSEYELNLRRQQNLVPGTKLEPTEADAHIPVLLIQRGGPSFDKAGISQKPLASHELIEGWTMILPRGWGLPFWKSLVFAGVRVAGFEDLRAMHYESGMPYFPHDYPSTRAFEVQRDLSKKAALAIWEKRPPGKRVNFKKRGIEHPFESAFETLATVEHMEVDKEGNLSIRPNCVLLQGQPLVSAALSPSHDAFQSKLDSLLKNRGITSQSPTFSLDDALVKIRVNYIGRGKPANHALVYVLENLDEYNACTYHMRHHTPVKKSKRKVKELLEVDNEAPDFSLAIPFKTQHIGYITNGNFSLTLGHGFGIGACTLSGLKKIISLDEV